MSEDSPYSSRLFTVVGWLFGIVAILLVIFGLIIVFFKWPILIGILVGVLAIWGIIAVAIGVVTKTIEGLQIAKLLPVKELEKDILTEYTGLLTFRLARYQWVDEITLFTGNDRLLMPRLESRAPDIKSNQKLPEPNDGLERFLVRFLGVEATKHRKSKTPWLYRPLKIYKILEILPLNEEGYCDEAIDIPIHEESFGSKQILPIDSAPQYNRPPPNAEIDVALLDNAGGEIGVLIFDARSYFLQAQLHDRDFYPFWEDNRRFLNGRLKPKRWIVLLDHNYSEGAARIEIAESEESVSWLQITRELFFERNFIKYHCLTCDRTFGPDEIVGGYRDRFGWNEQVYSCPEGHAILSKEWNISEDAILIG